MRRGARISLFVGIAALLVLLPLYSPSNRDALRSVLVSPSSGSRYPPQVPDLDPGWPDLPSPPDEYAELLPNGIPAVFDTPKLRPLGLKLDAFLRRPILSREEALEENLKHCPKDIADPLVNQDQLRGEHGFWDGIDRDEIAKRRVEIVKGLRDRVLKGESVLAGDSSSKKRGIVLAAGNRDTVDRAIFLLKHLKRLKVDLPVEIFHYPGELSDEAQREEIHRLGATIRAVSGVNKDEHLWKNFQIKGLAIVQSSFHQVLYLDSDNAPLRDPSYLFDSPAFLDNGRAAFWPDLYKDHPSNAIWRLVGETCTMDHWTFESGQIVVDKAGNNGLNYAALLIAAYMQSHHGYWFHMCGGDKDTFHWAFQILDLQWTHPPIWMSSLGHLNSWDSQRFCGHSIVQYDLVKSPGQDREQPLFVHSNLLKHMLTYGLNQGDVFTHLKRPKNDSYSSSALHHFRMDVYNGPIRGLCVDMYIQPSAKSQLSPGDLAGLEIQTIKVEDIDGQPFEGFEAAYFEEGGRLEGW